MCKAIEFLTPLLPPLSSLVFHLNSAKAGLSAPLSKSSFFSLDSSFIKKKKKSGKKKQNLPWFPSQPCLFPARSYFVPGSVCSYLPRLEPETSIVTVFFQGWKGWRGKGCSFGASGAPGWMAGRQGSKSVCVVGSSQATSRKSLVSRTPSFSYTFRLPYFPVWGWFLDFH